MIRLEEKDGEGGGRKEGASIVPTRSQSVTCHGGSQKPNPGLRIPQGYDFYICLASNLCGVAVRVFSSLLFSPTEVSRLRRTLLLSGNEPAK